MVPESRRRTVRWRWMAAGVGVLALTVALTAGLMNDRKPDVRQEKLSVAISNTPHAALLRIAEAQGFFKEEGLEMSFLPVTHGRAAIELVLGGQAELATTAEVPFVIAVMKGLELDLVATVAGVASEMAVVARRDRGIQRTSDLVGRTVGVTPGTSGEYFLWALMIRNRLAPDAVRLSHLAPKEMAAALAAGQVDAIASWEPVVHAARSAAGQQARVFHAPEAYRVTHVVAGLHDVLTRRPAAIEKLVRALLKAERYRLEQPEAALALVADWVGVEAAELKPAWQQIEFKVDLRQSQLITLEDEAQWAFARGHAKTGQQANFLPRLYLDALLSVDPRRVTVVH